MKSTKAEIHSRVHTIPTCRFEEEARLTPYAGIVVFQALFARLGMKARLRRCFSHLHVGEIFGHASITMLLVVHLLLGFRRLRGLDYYREDPLVARVVGLHKLPDVSTVSRTLRGMDDRSVDALLEENRRLVLDRVASERLSRITADFDGSVQSTTGHAEGTAVGFNKKKKGARSYYPLFCTLAQTDQFVDMHHRPGNVHDSNGATAFIDRCLQRLRAVAPAAQMECRVDSAFFSDTIFSAFQKHRAEFSCSVPFERFAELKVLAEERLRWKNIDDKWSFFETRWKPKCWSKKYRILFVRQKKKIRQKGPLQLDLFQPTSFSYDYRVIATNKLGKAKTVILFHHGRGSQEKMIGEAKQHAALDLIATRRRNGNRIFTIAGMLAHNLTRELHMAANESVRGTSRRRRARWQFRSLGTLRQSLIHRGGRLVRPQGHLTLVVNANKTVQRDITRYLNALQRVA